MKGVGSLTYIFGPVAELDNIAWTDGVYPYVHENDIFNSFPCRLLPWQRKIKKYEKSFFAFNCLKQGNLAYIYPYKDTPIRFLQNVMGKNIQEFWLPWQPYF